MRRLRATAALLILLALVIGVPAALAGTIGNPTSGLGDLLVGDVTDAALIGLLACVAWIGWAQFAVATLAELASALGGIRLPARIPGVLSGQQHLARSLVTAIFLLGPVAASTALPGATLGQLPPPTATVSLDETPASVSSPQAPAGATQAPPAQVSPSSAPAGSATQVYVVPGGGHGPATLWDIAEAHLGAGDRWREIWQLNEGRPQPGGATFTTPSRLLPGWTVLVPADPADPAESGARPVQAPLEVIVEPGDTLSELAAEHGQQDWQQIWQANADRAQPGGGRYTDPDLIRPGWRLTIPAAAVADLLPAAVAPAAPEPTPQADQPALPSQPVPPGPADVVPAAPSGSAGPSQPAASQPREGPPGVPGVPTAPGSAGDVPSTPSVAPAPTQATSSTSATTPTPAGTTPPAAARSEAPDRALEVLAFTGGGVLLAAGTLEALRRLRRRQFRDRTLGRTISSTPAELAPMEKALLARGAAGVPDVQWLQAALGSLARSLAAESAGTLPDVVAVRLGVDVLELVLTAVAWQAPAPWLVDNSGVRWSVRRDDDLATDSDERAGAEVVDVAAPYPTLVTVGRTAEGDHWLVDLERVGALSLTGDRDRCLDLVRFVAAELAHNAWSEQLLVTLVGFGDELAGLNPARILHRGSVDEATRDAHSTLRATAQLLHEADSTILEGRLRPEVVGDGWAPHVLLIAPARPADGTADSAALRTLLDDMRAQRARTAVAVVLAGDDETQDATRWQLHLDQDGLLTIPELGVRLIAQQLPAAEAADLAALLQLAAQSPDTAMPAAAGDQPWDVVADAAGAPLPELTRPPQQQPRHEHRQDGPLRTLPAAAEPDSAAVYQDAAPAPSQDGGSQRQGSSLLPLAQETYLASTATTLADVASLAPTVDPQVRRHVEQIDPTLDEDLQRWHDPDSGIAKLTLLGPVDISEASGAASGRRHDRVVEVVTYLACRPQGVTTEQWVEQMWPGDQQASPGRVRAYAQSARQWLGKHPTTGQDYLPHATAGPSKVGLYRLTGVLVDADLFRRLRLRGVARGAEGIADLETALQLVTGQPLSRLRQDGYAWLVDTPVQHHYAAMIVDVAHLVATHHLAAGDPARAEAAALVSLLAGSRDDVALLDLVAAKDAAGEHAQAQTYVARIMGNHDADVEEDLPPRTYEVLHRRRWLPNRDDAQAS